MFKGRISISGQVFLPNGSPEEAIHAAGTLKRGHDDRQSDSVYADCATRNVKTVPTTMPNNKDMHKASEQNKCGNDGSTFTHFTVGHQDDTH